jgi:D-arabinose 1-dehydrogenase-like Zn-dependent alcohol dehydrogenase
MSRQIPTSCRAVVIEKPGAPWAIKQVPISLPKAGQVLIKVHACGVCHSDSFLQQGAFGDGASFPRIPGHEVIGTIVAVGEGETKWKEGDRVGGPWHGGHDGVCKSCNRGLFQICQDAAVNGVSRDGGCEYIRPLDVSGQVGRRES